MSRPPSKPFTVSAPGSIMITGEHAVVAGHSAIVCAIAQRIRIAVTPLATQEVQITSAIAPDLIAPLAKLPQGGPYRFVLAALAKHSAPVGLRLEITSEIDPTLGLGSSAAITVAMLAALDRLSAVQGAGTGGDLGTLHTRGLAVVREIQGRGSGADLAASLHGGTLRYRLPRGMVGATPPRARAEIAPLPALPPLSLHYAGYKTPTAEVLARVAEAWAGREGALRALYAEMGASVETGIDALRAGEMSRLGQSLTAYQGHMAALGVSDTELEAIIAAASGHPGLIAAKISGSGLGDCVLALGDPPPGFTPVEVAGVGVRIDG